MGILSSGKVDSGSEELQFGDKGHLSMHGLMVLEGKIHEKLMDDMDPVELGSLDSNAMTREIQRVMSEFLAAEGVALPVRVRQHVVADVIDEVVGYGPIQPLLDDPTITEIMVNGANQVYAERNGKIFLTDKIFRDDAHVMRIIEKIVMPLGRRIDESVPMVDARLPDGSRVNAIIQPLAVRGPTLTVRKFSREPYTIKDLINFGTLTPQMADLLRACVVARVNIMISGGTGSGKTTSLNVLSSFVPNDERVVTIEDAAELQLQQDHVVRLESRPPNLEGKGEITIRMLVRNALRMRPDRIIVGEVRGGEALDMLQAMNTGHDGSLSTAHTNSPRDTLSRLETMTLMAGTELPSRAIREQIAAAIHVIIHQNRLRDGSRKITHITEIQGMEGDVITTQDIFLFQQRGVDSQGKVIGEHVPTGLRPKFLDRLIQAGVEVPMDIFKAR
ncbi:MAG TPA: CpaF family protein [Armatimonadota bacterium]|nr:CpaF family protein [Armatimonadota bacterium]